ncbi:TetR/AcrR family transcriptional regulator [Legionella pneumophila]|uniref:TetR/AcrR family transcriptional regulator n=1 Tax=Legionella pneumophila TaxID=446 RepID=UPI00399C7C02
MRYDKGRKEASHRLIMEVATKRFREYGIAASGIASIMNDAGLTNGAFYPHFESKEELVRECVSTAQINQSKLLQKALDAGGLELLITTYLSPEHRDAPGLGCISAALLGELSRQPSETRKHYTDGLLNLMRIMATALPKRGSDAEDVMLAVFSTLIGSLQLARAVEGPALSDRILGAGVDAARAILQSHQNNKTGEISI